MSKRYIAALLMIIGLLFSCSSSSNLPPPKWGRLEKSSVAERTFSPEGEYFLGRAVAANVLGRYGYLKNEELSRYLSLIVHFIAYKNDLPVPFNGYNLLLIDADEPYAFSTPGGFILISRGLLAKTRNEDELAGVIAHELGHLWSRDGINLIAQSKSASMLTGLGTLVASLVGGGGFAGALLSTFEGIVDHAVTNLTTKGFSRQQEYTADDLALKFMRQCGYSPAAYALFMQRALVDPEDQGLLATHPASAQRIEKIKREIGAQKVEAQGLLLRKQRFLQALN